MEVLLTPTGIIACVLVALLAVLGTIHMLGRKASGAGLDDVDTMDKTSGAAGVPLMIFFGTETGNAQMFAKTAAGEAEKHGFSPHVVDLEQFVPEMLTGDLSDCDADTRSRIEPMLAEGGPIAMFFMATCGEGDPTNSAREFVSWLEGEGGEHGSAGRDVSELRFAVFGLGNTSYEHYNAAGKQTDAGLAALGGQRIVELGLGDDNGELETQCEDWRLVAWPALRKTAGMGSGGDDRSAPRGSGGWESDLPSKQVAPFAFVPLEPPTRVKGACDTARDDLRAAGREEEASTAEEAVGGAGSAVGGSGGAARAWELDEPLRMVTRRQLLAMGADADPVRSKWFEAVPVRVTGCRELRQKPSTGAATSHVELDVGSACVSYGTADDASVLPENPKEQVEALCTWMGLDPSQWFTLEGEHIATALARSSAIASERGDAPAAASGKPASARSRTGTGDSGAFHGSSLPPGQEPVPFPVPCTVGKALQRYCDLNGPASKAFVGQLAHWASKEDDRRRMARLVSVEGRPEWEAWARKPQRSVLEVLEAFSSVKMPPEQLLFLLPPLKPREYTVASSAVANPGSMHLAVSVLDVPKALAPDGRDASSRRLRGVCSNYLAAFAETATAAAAPKTVRVAVRASTFKLPPDDSIPVIMIGPGTGLAPMRAFCQEREARAAAGATLGDALLFFGCRGKDQDFIYKEELERWVEARVLSELHTAFSRETKGSKVYVQHRLREQGSRVWSLIQDEGAYVYICGATAMGTEVTHTLATIAAEHGGMSEADSLAYVQGLERSHRLVQELWS